MEKPKILLVGGLSKEVHRLDKYVVIQNHVTGQRQVPTYLSDSYDAVVCIRKFTSKTWYVQAKKLAEKSHVPFVAPGTLGMVVTELEKALGVSLNGKTKEHQKVESAEGVNPEASAPEPDASVVHPPESEPDLPPAKAVEIDTEKLWEDFGQVATTCVNDLIKPGEKYSEATIVDLLSDGTTLPKEACSDLLQELAIRQILINIAYKTWRRPKFDNSDLEDVEPVIDPEPEPEPEAPKRKRRGDRMITMAMMFTGLPTGVYPYKKLYDAIRIKTGFEKEDGTVPTCKYFEQILRKAMSLGAVKRTVNGYVIENDPKMILTDRPAESAKPVVPDKPHEEPTLESVREALTGKKADAKGPVASSSKVDLVRQSFGGTIPWAGTWTIGLRRLKPLLPEIYWNELAARTIARRLKERDYESLVSLKSQFDAAEWDALVYDTLKNLQVDLILTLLRELPKDEVLKCVDCMADFVVTVGEIEFLEKKFGDEFAKPRRCQVCRKKERPL